MRNWIPYLGGLVAVVSLAGSASVFIYAHIRRPPPPIVSVAVIDLSDPGSITVLNNGNVDVLLTDLAFFCQPFLCGETISGGKVILKAGEVHTEELDNGAFGEIVPGDPVDYIRKVGRVSPDYAFRLYMAGHASTWFFRQLPEFKAMPAKAMLFYVPTSSTAQAQWHQVSVEVPLEAVLVHKGKKREKPSQAFNFSQQLTK
jgi:hypothetical protein